LKSISSLYSYKQPETARLMPPSKKDLFISGDHGSSDRHIRNLSISATYPYPQPLNPPEDLWKMVP
jgi:hypothetical protein